MSFRMVKVTVGPSVPLKDQIPIRANYANIEIIHKPKHNSDNENIAIHGLWVLLTSSQDELYEILKK